MFVYTHNGSENHHELHIVTDDMSKFMDLLEICTTLSEEVKPFEPIDSGSLEDIKLPCEEEEKKKKKPKFKFEDYKAENCVCMCCHNQEDYKKFNQFVIDSGRNSCVSSYDNFKCTPERPKCIYFFEGCNSSLDFAMEDEDCPLILYYEDFDWSEYKKEMK